MRITLTYNGHPNQEFPGGEELGDTENMVPIPRIGETVYSFWNKIPQALNVVAIEYYHFENTVLVIGEIPA